MLTGQDTLSNAIESIKLGAFHFIGKPYAPEELLSLMQRAFEQQELVRETASLREQTKELKALLSKAEARLAPVFKNRRMVEIEEFISQIAPSEANVLVTGESGVGKEVVANLIHTRSRRAAGPLVKLNCAALPQHLIEGELFGYVKGAFTGAVNDFSGMLAAAAGGTLFLDEIAEMPATLQTRFLRVLQEREFRPLGSTKTLKADFRLVAATNQQMTRALRDGRVAARPVLPDQHLPDRDPSPARPPGRHRAAGGTLHQTLFPTDGPAGAADSRREALATVAGFPVAGQRPAVAEHHRIRRRVSQGEHHHRGAACPRSCCCRRCCATSSRFFPRTQASPRPAGRVRRPGGVPDLDGSLNLDDRERQAILQALAQTHGNKLKAAKILGIHRPDALQQDEKRYGIAV